MKIWSDRRIDWRRKFGRLSIRFSVRGTDSLFGRFGGGWNWKLGVQVGGQTILISLLVAELTVTWEKHAQEQPAEATAKANPRRGARPAASKEGSP